MVELLSPAGNLEKLKYAFAYGADAVYAGIPDYSLRVKENKFDLLSLKKGINYAHDIDKKVYLTINFFPRYFDENAFIKRMEEIHALGADAYIVSDPGIIDIIRDNFKDAELHLSVQANTTNAYAVKFWYKQGIKRVILARELSIEEIRSIHKKVPQMELEFFVHGSLCMAYSGRCFLSAYLSGRNPFQGICNQPCRWKYKLKLIEVQDEDNEIIVEEDDKGSYLLSSKDLCLIKRLKELKDAGIISFKIEGRNKSEFYVAAVTKAYRIALDYLKEGKEPPYDELMKLLRATSNRKFIESYVDKIKPSELQTWNYTTSQQTHQYVGKITKVISSNKIKVLPKNKLKTGDDVEILVPGKNPGFLPAKIRKITYQGKEVESVSGGVNHFVEIDLDRNFDILEFGIILKIKNKNKEHKT
ncbi:MAG: hypothetical protein GXN99_01160 [Candidatus Nanohaloarchaeota archaeon]|nr:hypothetical protein [Candidatus Nanohaloarchaeota archaeon]